MGGSNSFNPSCTPEGKKVADLSVRRQFRVAVFLSFPAKGEATPCPLHLHHLVFLLPVLPRDRLACCTPVHLRYYFCLRALVQKRCLSKTTRKDTYLMARREDKEGCSFGDGGW
ncbi:hypothetical protein AVEN_80642-1 [Araneus ventricosus]|uniref:Uncharacterized protein n=1 Tax=Araneus ventricosus TaxID=182803 RepID=A0A4Y2P4C1_ARAVE|nr:hypothetical protein AVEN_80642-1 [Araneus ventricosus]